VSLELVDVRVKVSPEAHAALSAFAEADGVELGELARSILHSWAETRIKAASVLQRRLKAAGIVGDREG